MKRMRGEHLDPPLDTVIPYQGHGAPCPNLPGNGSFTANSAP